MHLIHRSGAEKEFTGTFLCAFTLFIKILRCWSNSLIPVSTKSTVVLETSTVSVLFGSVYCEENC